MDLFDFTPEEPKKHQPLAERMRPRNLDEFFGQKHLLGEGKVLRRAIETDRLTSMILQGPPSSGKTSLATIISQMTNAHFVRLNAVSLGMADLRNAVETAREDYKLYQKRTILFIDEIHALKSNVQMSLLPAVEDGTITLIGATTESVMHDIIPPLVSRCRVYTLTPLSDEEVKEIIATALTDPQRGLGEEDLSIDEDAMRYLVDVSNGDIRNALSALETAYYSLWDTKTITLEKVKEAYQLRLNNTSTTDFYNLTSALIKSMRGGQTDAAIYWLARLLYVGVDPLYIARRIVVHAVEDVGMANPHALQVAVAAKEAVQFIGMPEARLPLAEAVIYICESPKSNSAYKAINKAMDLVRNTKAYDVPADIRDGSKSYVNPIDHPNSRIAYLPPEVNGSSFYKPQNSGVEAKIYARYFGEKGTQ
ncbi:replication-associated recombination protein A [Brevibacillus sp. TJ4]|uniref:replication-associated recombination protein A n=1 Tax=Brevibacillus sp. TJ4 TaxID=3234853 RepID=UPI003B9ECDA4